MVATLGFDQLAGMWVVIHLDHPRAALFGGAGGSGAGLARVWIKDQDNVTQAFAVGFHQPLKLFFKFDFFFQAGVILQGFQLGQLFLKGFFCCAKFGESGQNLYSNSVFG